MNTFVSFSRFSPSYLFEIIFNNKEIFINISCFSLPTARFYLHTYNIIKLANSMCCKIKFICLLRKFPHAFLVVLENVQISLFILQHYYG